MISAGVSSLSPGKMEGDIASLDVMAAEGLVNPLDSFLPASVEDALPRTTLKRGDSAQSRDEKRASRAILNFEFGGKKPRLQCDMVLDSLYFRASATRSTSPKHLGPPGLVQLDLRASTRRDAGIDSAIGRTTAVRNLQVIGLLGNRA
ncbi:hypothetical protein HPB47_008417 [Ixodes persulcatus]|uniref:Uncharacterized protein n=1 Tax=Ixodes persulcatus TaxID=34615 RepID=A0AC60P5T2_IXOPE|nr:hypothetical protein HPB47_008417 [Ixodes persulcatus]